MNETWVTVVGNVASDVTWRRTPNGNEVANFRLMSTERRYDSESGSWEDGHRVAVGVACWRRLGENVRSCVTKGDPVVVRGKLYVREFEVDGVRRSSTEIEARSVGLDLGKVCAKVVPTDAAPGGRPPVDVSGLAVVDAGTNPTDPEEMRAASARVSSALGGFATAEPAADAEDGDDHLTRSDGDVDTESALAS